MQILHVLVPLLLAWFTPDITDPSCPAYPAEQRALVAARIRSERNAPRTGRANIRPRSSAGNANFIDNYLFSAMDGAGVVPAPPATDEEFLRRVTLDLTGRIPTPDQVTAFVNDSNPAKDATLIDSLIGTSAFVDYWTLYLANQFQVTSSYYAFIGIPGRNQFYRYLHDFVDKDRPFADLATEVITATGDSFASGQPNFIMRGLQYSGPIQDTWDELTNTVTTIFLGVQTQCISCHDGRGHLEKINLYLSQRKRQDFWRQSAFFSRMSILDLPADASNYQRKGIISDRTTGAYNGVLADPANPGPRPPRTGGPYNAQFLFSGQVPGSGQWRRELARLVVSDPQFASATVNYLWAHFFRVGIVDPPNGWDLARQDPSAPPDPSSGFGIQPSNAALLNALAQDFAANGTSLRHTIRLMATSRAYRLSSRHPSWQPQYAFYFAKSFPRRLSAEEIYDAMVQATLTPTPMFVEGFDQPLQWAGQLPDPTEPRSDTAIQEFLNTFGRGDWFQKPRDTRSNVVQVLYLMNHYEVNYRTLGNRYYTGSSLVEQLSPGTDDQAAVRMLCLAALGRQPTDNEMAVAIKNRRGSRDDWMSDVQWSMLNELEFLFNH